MLCTSDPSLVCPILLESPMMHTLCYCAWLLIQQISALYFSVILAKLFKQTSKSRFISSLYSRLCVAQEAPRPLKGAKAKDYHL